MIAQVTEQLAMNFLRELMTSWAILKQVMQLWIILVVTGICVWCIQRHCATCTLCKDTNYSWGEIMHKLRTLIILFQY